jgi:Helix-loop-helix DNA-binding domain
LKVKLVKLINLDYVMEDYYSTNRTNVTTTSVNYNNNVIMNKSNINLVTSNELEPVPVVRVVRKRNTANKKERRRTQSINSAYSSLREHIPNVPSDTKLSKVS